MTRVHELDGFVSLEYDGNDGAPVCKPNARWMGVNLLCELDAPGEYYIDAAAETIYLYPPAPLAEDDVVMLGYQPDAIVNITSAVENAALANRDVRDGRHVGILAVGAKGLVIAVDKDWCAGSRSHGLCAYNLQPGARARRPVTAQ